MIQALIKPVGWTFPTRLPLMLAVSAALCTGPFWMDNGVQHTVVEFLLYLTLAQLWNLLAGYAGLISIGQQAFVGLGGYALFSLSMLMGVPILLALPLAGLVAALVAFPTALVAFRLSGPHFAIGTWVIAEVFRLTFAQIGPLGGGLWDLPALKNRKVDLSDARPTRQHHLRASSSHKFCRCRRDLGHDEITDRAWTCSHAR